MIDNRKSLKVLFWRTDFYGGITEGGTASLHIGKIVGFNKLGHKIAYASSGPMVLPEYVSYHYIPYSKFLRNFPEVLNLPYNEKSIKAFTKIIEMEKPDFFYQHHHDFHYGGAVIKERLGLPFILHVDGIEYWVKKNWGKLYFGKLLKWAEEIQIHQADAIITPSEALKRQILELFPVDPDKIVPAPNGVDPATFHPGIDGSGIRKELGIEDKFVCGFTGTFGHWHGVDVLAESVKHIVKLIPNAVVLFVGDGLLRPKIEDILKRDGVRDKVIITGFLPYKQIPSYLAACDILMSPCVNNPDSEFFNSPVKLFEYMAMAKPIVATDVGQQGVIFQHKRNGYVCPEQEPEALAEAALELYKNPELRKSIGEAALTDAIEKYDWKFNSQLIVDAYYRIISKKSSERK